MRDRRSKDRECKRWWNEKVETHTNATLLSIVVAAIESNQMLTRKSRNALLKRFGVMVELYATSEVFMEGRREESDETEKLEDDV